MARLVQIRSGERQWSKEEELQLLEEMMEQLQPNSYLAHILRGIDRYAKIQMQNDWALSITDELNEAHAEIIRLTAEISKLRVANETLTKENARLEKEANRFYHDLRSTVEDRARITAERDQFMMLAERQANEIIRLKARLFDYIGEPRTRAITPSEEGYMADPRRD